MEASSFLENLFSRLPDVDAANEPVLTTDDIDKEFNYPDCSDSHLFDLDSTADDDVLACHSANSIYSDVVQSVSDQTPDQVRMSFFIDRPSLDRFLPMYNVAANIATRTQYDKFTFVLIFVPIGDRLRLFAIRTFVDHEAELVRDIMLHVQRRMFDEFLPSAKCSDKVSFSDALRTAFARYCISGNRSAYFPHVFIYIARLQDFIESVIAHCNSSNANDSLDNPFTLLCASREHLQQTLIELFSRDANVDAEENVLRLLSERLKRKRNKDDGGRREEKRTKSDSEISRRICESLNDDPDYWSQRFSETNETNSVAGVITSSPVVDDSPTSQNSLLDTSVLSEMPSDMSQRYVLFFSENSSATELICALRNAFATVDPYLFSSERLHRDLGNYDRESLRTLFFASLHVQYFAARNKLNDIVRFVYLRSLENKTPDTRYQTELSFSRNFTTYFDYFEIVSLVGPLVKTVNFIDSSRILIPLEWLPNQLIRDTLRSWSDFDIEIVPSLDADNNYNYTSLLARSPWSAEHQRWLEYVCRVQNQASRIFDIDAPDVSIAKRTSDNVQAKQLSVGQLLFANEPNCLSPDVTNIFSDVSTALDVVLKRTAKKKKRSDCAFWIFSVVRGDGSKTAYGVKPSMCGPNDICDQTADALHDESLIRLTLVEKMPRNSNCCSWWKSGAREPADFDVPTTSADQLETLACNINFNDCAFEKSEPSIPYILARFVKEQSSDQVVDDIPSRVRSCAEQLLFLDILLRRSEPRFPVMVNGNPGTGKSTVMNFVTRLFSRDAFVLMPTNVLRERALASLQNDSTICDSALKIVRRPNVENENSYFIDDQPVILTVSSFIKRVLRYNMGPDVYSKIVKLYLDQQLERLKLTLRPMSVTRDLFPLEKPVARLLYPPTMQVDEYNLCSYSEHFIVGKACEQLGVSRVYYGDFAQSSPIRGVNDNAELIALFAPLTVQFLDNKRLLASPTSDDDDSLPSCTDKDQVDLRSLLSDPVWNWKANNCDDGTNDYVRRLISRLVVSPLLRQLDDRPSSEVQIDEWMLDQWYQRLSVLNDWYDEQPCRRYLYDIATLEQFVGQHYPTIALPCFISRRNVDSDRINYWLSRLVQEYVERKCGQVEDRSASKSFANCFCLTVHRSALVTADVLAQKHDLDIVVDPDNPSFMRITDDPWCSSLTLILGAVYRYIGPVTKTLSSDTLLRLVAFLPADSPNPDTGDGRRSALLSNSKKSSSHDWGGYFCKLAACACGCEQVLGALRQKLASVRKLAQFARNDVAEDLHNSVLSSHSLTLGCGMPFGQHRDITCQRYVPNHPRLLMQRLRTRDDLLPTLDQTTDATFVVLNRSRYTLNRCNSKWTTNLYTNRAPREGMQLFGYPLVLNCAVSSWRVQGETIPLSDVYVDLKHMNKQQALVSLSRVRHSEQIRGILNIKLYGTDRAE